MNIMEVVTSPTFIWLAIAIVLAVIEAVTLGLTCIWFAGGAFVTAVVSMTHIGAIAQISIFVVVSCVLFFVFVPMAKKKLNNNVEQTNVNSVIGLRAIVEEPITRDRSGRVSAEGKLWTAVLAETEKECELVRGARVVIKGIKGVTVIVETEQA